MTTVVVLGTFDLLHPGHVRFLRAASSQGDRLVVAVNTDKFAERFKRRPIMTEQERMEMIRALPFVYGQWFNDGFDQPGLILQTRAKIIVHGDDWTGPDYMRQLNVTEEWLAERGIEIRYVPYTAGISTSEIIQRAAISHAEFLAYMERVAGISAYAR